MVQSMDYNSNVYWSVAKKIFYNKFDALTYASQIKQRVNFSFYDDTWDKFSRLGLGTTNLNELYKKRAQQLRDEYDYLILYFSGGADSFNVLRSFIDNGIRLDEVCVKWPMVVIEKQLYTPNTRDATAYNYLSEWDYAIKPVLDQLAQTHPEIKIEISDWSENFTPDIYNEENLKKVGAWNDVEIGYTLATSPNEIKLAEKGKRVASIYGIEKPLIGYGENAWWMSFEDAAINVGIPMEHSQNTIEYFYWSPKMPELAFEQAYCLCRYLEINPNKSKYFLGKDSKYWTPVDHQINHQVRNNITKSVIYTTWDNKFQTNKPVLDDRSDKQSWIFSHPELTKHRDAFIDINSELLSKLDRAAYRVDHYGFQVKNKIRGRFVNVSTKWHFVKTDETVTPTVD